jgi:mannose-6-phosphate isomerase-like protein (cupin superfamily)
MEEELPMDERSRPQVVPLDSVPPVPKEDAPTKVRIARLITKSRTGSQLLMGVAWLDPGDSTNWWSTEDVNSTDEGEHYYGPLHETYFVLGGRFRLSWTKGELEFGANDAVSLPAGWRYKLECISDEPGYLVYSFTPPPE